MNLLLDFLASPLADRIGLTILHSLWQLTLLAIVAALLLEILRRTSSQPRYLLSYFTLGRVDQLDAFQNQRIPALCRCFER